MRRLFLAFLSALFFLAAHSQNNGKDSLLHLLSLAKEDTNKVYVLVGLSKEYTDAKPDTAMLYARQALRLSRELTFKKGEALALSSLALSYLYATNRPKALENYLKALKIYEGLKDKSGIAISLDNIGLCYVDQEEYQLALTYLHQSKAINEKLQNQPQLLNNLLILAGCFERMDRLDSARHYANQASELALQLRDKEKIGMISRNLGDIYTKMNQPGLAMEYYRLSLPFHHEANNNFGISNSTIGMAKLFRSAGQKDSALHYARLSLTAARNGGFPQSILRASSFLTDYYDSLGQIDSAYVYQKIAVNIKDTLFSQEKIKRVQQLTFNEQARQHEIALQQEKRAQERKENLQLLVIAICIPIFFLLVMLLSRSKAKIKSIELLGRLSLLLFFEFIALFIHPHIAEWTHHSPVLMLLILVGIGAVLVPLHNKLEHWLESLILKKQLSTLEASKEGTITLTPQQVKPEEHKNVLK